MCHLVHIIQWFFGTQLTYRSPRYDHPSEEFWLDPLTLKFGPYVYASIYYKSPWLPCLPRRTLEVGDRWERRVHPEGGLYFCDREKVCPFINLISRRYASFAQRVLTDTYMHEELPRNTINDFVDKIEQFIAKNGLAPPVLPENRTLVLEIRQTGRCGYYFVDHSNQCLFWLEPYNAFDMIDNFKIEMTLPLFGASSYLPGIIISCLALASRMEDEIAILVP